MNSIASPIAAVESGSSRYVLYAIVLLTVVNACSFMDRTALAVLAPLIKAELFLSDAQLGLLIGFAFSLFFAVSGIPIARWADRGIRRDIITLALTTWSVATALSGVAQNFWHLFLARMGIGAGEAGCVPSAQSLICDYVPFKRRPGVFAFYNFGGTVGAVFGLVFASWLGEAIGWRWTFLALGAPGIALAVAVRCTLREPVRGTFDAKKESSTSLPLGATICVLWRCRTYRWLTLVYVTTGFVQYGLGQWWPSFYVRTFGLSVSSIGMYLGSAMGVGTGLGTLIGGLLANKAAQRDVRLPLFIGAASTLMALPAALGSLFVQSTVVSMFLVSLTTMLWSVSIGPIIATVASVVSSSMRATAASITIFCASVLGFGLGPFCVGLLSDWLTPSLGTQALRYALLAPTCLIPIMAVAAYAAARDLTSDLNAMGTMAG